MRAILLGSLLLAATAAGAQIHLLPKDHVLRNGTSEPEEESAKKSAPVNLRPTQLLRCPDGKGGFLMQDTPCREPAAAGAAPTPVGEATDLSALQPRQRVAEAPPPRVEAKSRWTQALLGGARLALMLAALYAVYRLGRYARDRFRQRFGEAELPNLPARRIH